MSSTGTPPVRPLLSWEKDPTADTYHKMGKNVVSYALFAVLGLSLVLLGALDFFGMSYEPWPFFKPYARAVFVTGIILFCISILIVVIMLGAGYYLRSMHTKRQLAYQHPERFQAQVQPAPVAVLPEVQKLRLHMTILWRWSFFSLLLVPLLTLGIIAFFPVSWWQGLTFSLVVVGLTLAITQKSNSMATEQIIEITTEGIYEKGLGKNTYISWSDARIFSTYKVRRMFNRSASVHTYELVGEHTLVRWSDNRARGLVYTLLPRMSKSEYERWIEQLNGYVVERTGLTLIDLNREDRR